MNIKHKELDIPEDDPFFNCKLERKPYARVLTDIVTSYADGFVLAINNEWGAGKTTFVKMWKQQLKKEGFQTIYFNAWENDFDSNPLVALMSELETLTDEDEVKKEGFKSVIEKGAVFFKNMAPSFAKEIFKKYVADIDNITADAIENATKASTEILAEEIKEYTSKKKTIIDFREALEKFVAKGENNKPLIFIVDELDRCRPTYAVEVLEQIKHFFAVPGIVFVLSIDKTQLANAVNGFYGSERIDSNEYLRRFIDLEYSIPTPQPQLVNRYLFEYYQINDFMLSSERTKSNQFSGDERDLLRIADILFKKYRPTIRQQERVFSLTRLVLCSFRNTDYIFSDILFFLVYIKILRNDLYRKINNNILSLHELSSEFGDLMLTDDMENDSTFLVYSETLLLWLYNNNQPHWKKMKLGTKNSDLINTVHIKSKLLIKGEYIESYFDSINDQRNYRISLDFLLKKINLTEPIITL